MSTVVQPANVYPVGDLTVQGYESLSHFDDKRRMPLAEPYGGSGDDSERAEPIEYRVGY